MSEKTVLHVGLSARYGEPKDHARLEFAYGYGTLNRFNVAGTTQFLQSRLQLQF
jgi:hypothetical protein